ncbi:uncharacterized protein [Phaseolus vulgaris]|uniref:uncharacterized protein n=1 Tax=Phaseolus vulgaris TaxID=3885 RepID=UPI0035C9BA5B
MKRALLSKNKFKFVSGEIPEPTRKSKQYEAWERCNVIVISWINRSLITQIAQSTNYIDNTRDLWEDLKERFSKSNHFCTSDLLQEINSIRQGERSISEYYTDFRILWEELDSLRPIPTCICSSKCTCKSWILDTGATDHSVIDAKTREIFVSKNVLFYEKIFCQVIDKSEQNELSYDQNFMEHMYDSYHRGNMNEVANTENRDTEDLRRSTRTQRSHAYLEDYHHQLLTSSEKGISSTTFLANSPEETPVLSPLVPVSSLGSSKGEYQKQKAVTKPEKVQAILKRIKQQLVFLH